MYLARPFIARLPSRWAFCELEDFAVLPALILAISVRHFLSESDRQRLVAKHQEHEADAF